jgi:ribosomal protein L40E
MSLFDAYQDLELRRLSESMVEQDTTVLALTGRVNRLEHGFTAETKKLDRLCRAMWSLIAENTDLTDEDLKARIDELTIQEEPQVEGLEQLKVTCVRCGAVVPPDLDKCQFCGESL